MISDPEQKIYLVDDDKSVLKGISLLLKSAFHTVETFPDVTSFLNSETVSEKGCIILDIFLRAESGLNLQDTIKYRFPTLPIIYISGHGDIPMSVQALRKGAVNFLQKPVDGDLLLKAVEEALSQSTWLFEDQNETSRIKLLIGSLTPREFEIFRMVIRGMLNKQIAAELNIAEHTVKLHRGKITEKMGVKSVPELIYIARKLNLD